MTAENLLNKIEQLNFLLNNPAEPQINVRELGRMRSVIYEDFKMTSFATKEAKDNAWSVFQSAVARLKQEQEKSAAESKAFAEKAIEDLNQLYNSLTEKAEDHSKEVITGLKEEIALVFQYFKQPNWPNKEMKEENWTKFSAIRDVVRLKEDKYYEAFRIEKEKLTSMSDMLANKLVDIVTHCHPNAEVRALYASLESMQNAATDANVVGEQESHFIASFEEDKPLKSKSEALRTVRKFIAESRDYLTREDKQKIFANIDLVQKDLDEAWVQHKDDMQRKRDDWAQRQQAMELKKTEWLENQRSFATMLEGRISNQSQFKQQLEGFLLKQVEFAKKSEERINNQNEYLNKLDQQVLDLDEKIATARADSFKAKAETWLAETFEKKSKVMKEVEELKLKIMDADKRKVELTKKIADIEKSIQDIKEKHTEVTDKIATA